jgi:hypothetical protein
MKQPCFLRGALSALFPPNSRSVRGDQFQNLRSIDAIWYYWLSEQVVLFDDAIWYYWLSEQVVLFDDAIWYYWLSEQVVLFDGAACISYCL